MDAKKLKELEVSLLEAMPSGSNVQVGQLVSGFANDPSGFGMSNARAALLQLAEDGVVSLDGAGNVRRK